MIKQGIWGGQWEVFMEWPSSPLIPDELSGIALVRSVRTGWLGYMASDSLTDITPGQGQVCGYTCQTCPAAVACHSATDEDADVDYGELAALLDGTHPFL